MNEEKDCSARDQFVIKDCPICLSPGSRIVVNGVAYAAGPDETVYGVLENGTFRRLTEEEFAKIGGKK